MQPGRLPIAATGSLQNPAFSPDGTKLCFTRWLDAYNEGMASVGIHDLTTDTTDFLGLSGEANVSQPGSCWNERGIILSSDGYFPEGDRACYWDGRAVHVLNSQDGMQTWEPSWGPDFYVAERHVKGAGHGQIIKAKLDALGSIQNLTDIARDCRQPCVSPDGKYVVFQEKRAGGWQVRLMDTVQRWDKAIVPGTDATFGPDGKRIVFSDNDGHLAVVNLANYEVTRVATATNYAGAPSFSRDGRFIAYEGGPSGDDGGLPTSIYIAAVP